MFENRRIAIFLGIAPIYLLSKTTALHGLNTFHSSFNHGIGLKLCKQVHVLIERLKEELSFYYMSNCVGKSGSRNASPLSAALEMNTKYASPKQMRSFRTTVTNIIKIARQSYLSRALCARNPINFSAIFVRFFGVLGSYGNSGLQNER